MKIEEVEGSIFLDDPKNTDISHYNILNNKVYIQYDGDLPEIRTDENFVVSSTIATNIDISQPYNIIVLSDSVIICTKNLIHLVFEDRSFKIPVDTGFQSNGHDWTAEKLDNKFAITVTCFVNDPANLSNPYDIITAKKFIKYFEIDNSGNIITENTITATDESNISLLSGYGYIIVLEFINSGYNIYSAGIAGDAELTAIDDTVNWLAMTMRFQLKVSVNDETRYNWVIPGNNHLILIKSPDGSDTVTELSICKYDGSVDRRYDFFDDEYISNENIKYLTNTEYFAIFRNNKLSCIDVLTKSVRLLSWTAAANNLSALTSEGISANISDITIYKYRDGSKIYYTSENAIFAEERVIVRPTAVVWRETGLQVKSEERLTETIPVISDIDEKIITGFFLDNCWWFVTEHSVFGTGVGANGIMTIERFDPLKYFKFPEAITAAIRISDTSFWVFHNNGAYLIYKTSLTILNNTEYRWLCTATAKSKGCDFENAVTVLPISNNVVTVTKDDICVVQMKENIQSDERSLVPITLNFTDNIRQLLSETESVKILSYKYLTIFALNKIVKDGITPAVVYDNSSNNWWYWEFPVNQIANIYSNITDDIFVCPDENVSLKLTSDEYNYTVGSLDYEIYADRIFSQEPIQIEWSWQSAMQLFGTIERRKQLLFTTFVFDDFMPTSDSEQLLEFEYYFNIYSKTYSTSTPDSTTATVHRVSNKANKTTVASFNYLQLVIHNSDFDSNELNFEVLTKPKICSISFKYRLLRGELI